MNILIDIPLNVKLLLKPEQFDEPNRHREVAKVEKGVL